MLCLGLDSVEGRALELMFLFGSQLAKKSKQGVEEAAVRENRFVSFRECHLNGL